MTAIQGHDELDFVKAQLARLPGSGIHPSSDGRHHSLQHGRAGHHLV
jgi:hypothetical protein